MSYPKLKVGAHVYLADGGSLPVTKVGRKYFYLKRKGSELRFFVETWVQDTGFGHHEQAYMDEESFLHVKEIINWQRTFSLVFRQQVGTKRFSRLQLREAAEILGIELGDES